MANVRVRAEDTISPEYRKLLENLYAKVEVHPGR